MDVPHPRVRAARSLAMEFAVALLFAVLAVAMTWPLAPNITRAVSDPGDPYFTTWVLDWDFYATAHHQSLFDANIFWPAHQVLAFSEHMYGIALVLFPLFILGVAPLTIHNIGMLLGFAGCGYAMYALARYATGSRLAGIIGGIAYAFVGFRFHHLPHLHFVWSLWLPVMLLTLLAFAARPTFGRSAALCAAFVMNGLSALHWLVFGALAITLSAVLLAVITARWKSVRYWALLAGAGLLSIAILLPFLLPYVRVAKEYGMHRYYAETLPFSGEWRDWLQPTYQSKVYGTLSPAAAYGHERTLFPGFCVFGLAILGLGFWRREEAGTPIRASMHIRVLDAACGLLLFATAWGAMIGTVRVAPFGLPLLSYTGVAAPGLCLLACASIRCWMQWPTRPSGSLRELIADRIPVALVLAVLWIALGALGALGLHGMLDGFLFDHVSAFRSIRVPTRWAMLAYVGLALLAAAGAANILRRWDGAARVVVALSLATVMLLELRTAPLRWYIAPLVPQPVYDWLKDAPFRGAVVEFPMTQDSAYEYLWHATVHHRPLINGVSSYTPPGYDNVAAKYQADPIPDDLLADLEARHCSVIVVHDGLIQARSDTVRGWLRRAVKAGRLVFVRRFDAGNRPDYVFALSRLEPNAMTWRVPALPDPAGFTLEQNADRFLATDPLSYSGQTMANIDKGPAANVRGALDIAGWATSPVGIRRVNVRLANGRGMVAAERTDRGDVTALLPWHPPVFGFAVHVPSQPAVARGETDLQVEIVDGRGHSRFMPPVWFRWSKAPARRLPWNVGALDALLARLGQDPQKVRPAILDGRATVEDFVGVLVTDPNDVTDGVFVRRAASILLDDSGPAIIDPYLRALSRGTSRERVISAILHSRAFAARYTGGVPI